MAAYLAPNGLSRTITGRAVHLRILPRIENIAQSREILRLMQRFGEVEMYRNLRYDLLTMPNAALVVFKSGESAHRLLRQSPLRFTMQFDQSGNAYSGYEGKKQPAWTSHGADEAREQKTSFAESSTRGLDQERITPTSSPALNPWSNNHPAPFPSGAWGLSHGQERRLSTAQPRRQPLPLAPPDTPPTEPRMYQLQVNVSRFNHRNHINGNPYNGSFAIDTKSAVHEELAKKVPLIGLSQVDITKMEKPWKTQNTHREIEIRARKPLRQMLEWGKRWGGDRHDTQEA